MDAFALLGPIAAEGATRLCKALLPKSISGARRRAIVEAVTRVLDVEGMGRTASAALFPVLEPAALGLTLAAIEEALVEAWGFERATVTRRGEPVGDFELPGSVFERTTRRIDALADVVVFTVVDDRMRGTGFVGVWDRDGRLIWAPPGARDLRFHDGGVELLFDTWRERRDWPSRELVNRTPQSGLYEGERCIRLAFSPQGRAVVLTFVDENGYSYLFADGVRTDWCSYDVPAAVDVSFSSSGALCGVIAMSGKDWAAAESDEEECNAFSFFVHSFTHRRGYQTAWYMPRPTGTAEELAAAEIVEPLTFVSDVELIIHSSWAEPRTVPIETSYLEPYKPSPTRIHWEPVSVAAPRPVAKVERWRPIGDFGASLLEEDVTLELPSAVDFEPLPLASFARGPGNVFAATLRPPAGPEPKGLAVYSFPVGGDGISCIWDGTSGKLLHEFAEPGELAWLDDGVLLVFHADSFEACAWPSLETQWKIPLVSPIVGRDAPGTPLLLSIAPNGELAAVTWRRTFMDRSSEAFSGVEIVDLKERRQRFGETLLVDNMPFEPRGPTFSPDNRYVALSIGDGYWFALDGELRQNNERIVVGYVVVFDRASGTVVRAPVKIMTPGYATPTSFRGLNVIGVPRFVSEREWIVRLPFGTDLAVVIEDDRERRARRLPEPSASRPRCDVDLGEGPTFARFPVPLELPYGMDHACLWARRVSWSRSRDRVAMTLVEHGDRAGSIVTGIWETATGRLHEVLLAAAAIFAQMDDDRLFRIPETGEWGGIQSVRVASQAVHTHGSLRRATDLSLSPNERWIAVVEEGGRFVDLVSTMADATKWEHDLRCPSSIRGPVWSPDSRYLVVAALHDATDALGDLVVIDTQTGRVRETVIDSVGERGERGRLSIGLDGSIALYGEGGVWRTHLHAVVPLEATSLLRTPLVIPARGGVEAIDEVDRIPLLRLAPTEIDVANFRDVLWQMASRDDFTEESTQAADLLTELTDILLPEHPPWRFDARTTFLIPFLGAFVAEDVQQRSDVVALLARIFHVADATDDEATLAAFEASREWLAAGATTSRELGAFLSRMR